MMTTTKDQNTSLAYKRDVTGHLLAVLIDLGEVEISIFPFEEELELVSYSIELESLEEGKFYVGLNEHAYQLLNEEIDFGEYLKYPKNVLRNFLNSTALNIYNHDKI